VLGSGETSSVVSYTWNCWNFSIIKLCKLLFQSNTKAVMFDNPASFAELSWIWLIFYAELSRAANIVSLHIFQTKILSNYWIEFNYELMIDEVLTLFSIKLPICVVLRPGAAHSAHKSSFTNNLNKKISDIFLSYEISNTQTKCWRLSIKGDGHTIQTANFERILFGILLFYLFYYQKQNVPNTMDSQIAFNYV
jgi:hypothetical protein